MRAHPTRALSLPIPARGAVKRRGAPGPPPLLPPPQTSWCGGSWIGRPDPIERRARAWPSDLGASPPTCLFSLRTPYGREGAAALRRVRHRGPAASQALEAPSPASSPESLCKLPVAGGPPPSPRCGCRYGPGAAGSLRRGTVAAARVTGPERPWEAAGPWCRARRSARPALCRPTGARLEAGARGHSGRRLDTGRRAGWAWLRGAHGDCGCKHPPQGDWRPCLHCGAGSYPRAARVVALHDRPADQTLSAPP